MTVTVSTQKMHLVTLRDVIADVKPGFAVGERAPDGVIQVRMNNVDTEGNLDLTNVIRVPATEKQIADCSLIGGDVLFNNTNSTELVGKSTAFRGHSEPVTFSNHFTRLRVDPKRLDPFYLARWLTRQQQCRVFEGLCTRWVGQSAVRTEKLLSLKIPLPPLHDQQRIAVILDKADDFRRKRKVAIDHFECLGASIFSKLFAKEIRSALRIPLHKLIDLRYGTSNKSATVGKPTLRIPNVVNGVVDLKNLKQVPVTDTEFEKLRLVDGDVLFVRTNGNPNYVGRCAVFDEGELKKADHNPAEFIYASYLIRGRLSRQILNPLFLQHFLQTPAGKQALRDRSRTSAGQYNINTRGIGSIEIPSIPLERQQQFAAHIAALKPVRQRLGTAIDDADDLFNTLVQSAFHGKL